MIARARAWLDQWQINPSAVPVLLAMLAVGGTGAILAAVDVGNTPASYLLAALGIACLVISLWLSQRLSDDDRNGVKFGVRMIGTGGIMNWLEQILSSAPVHWVYEFSLWAVIFLLLEQVVDLLEAGVRRLRRSRQVVSTARRGP